jgi:hydroxyethylthiazole kinase
MTDTANELDLTIALNNVRATTPLVHCITNYVTVNDCANALLACGGSPIMSDEPQDVEDITSICGGLVLNIGTLNAQTIEGMKAAGAKASELKHAIVLDPVGAGASKLRTETAAMLLDTCDVRVIRANMSEAKALTGASNTTRGVDVNPDDAVTPDNLEASAKYARELAASTGAIVAITGAIDLVADAESAYAIYNGCPLMGRITGAGCMLSCVVAAYVVANPEDPLDAVVAAVAGHGVCGEIAAERMKPADGNGSFRTYLLDALYNLDAETLCTRAKVEKII